MVFKTYLFRPTFKVLPRNSAPSMASTAACASASVAMVMVAHPFNRPGWASIGILMATTVPYSPNSRRNACSTSAADSSTDKFVTMISVFATTRAGAPDLLLDGAPDCAAAGNGCTVAARMAVARAITGADRKSFIMASCWQGWRHKYAPSATNAERAERRRLSENSLKNAGLVNLDACPVTCPRTSSAIMGAVAHECVPG